MRNKTLRCLRISTVGAIAALMYAGAAFSSGNGGPMLNDPADVKALTDIETYLNLQVDMKPIMADYAPNVVVYDGTGGVYQGSKQLYDGFEPQLVRMRSNKLDIPDLNIISDGKLACVAMQLHYDATYKSGDLASYKYREIDVFRKIGSKWVMVQSHLSFPGDLKTGAAVMDGPIQKIGHIEWGPDMLQTPAEDPGQAKSEILKWALEDANTIDVNHYPQLYGPGDVMIYDSLYPGNLRGLGAIADYYRPFFADVKDAKATIPQSDVETDGVLGAVIEQQTLAITNKDGSQRTMSFRQNDCLHRVDGKWYSVMEMNSFPTDYKSGKFLMNSPPAS